MYIGAKEPGYFTSDRLDLFQAYAHQAAIALESARLFTDRTMRLERLRALRTIDLAVSSNVDLTANIQVVLEQVTRQLGVDAADIMLLDREKQMLTYGGRHGFDTRVTEPLSIELDDDPAGAVIREGIVVCKSLQGLDGSTNFGRMVVEEGFVTYIGVPLVAKNRPVPRERVVGVR